MSNKNSKLSVGLAVLFEIILMYTAMVNIATRQWNHLTLTLLAMVCLMLPFVVTRVANIMSIILPSSFQVITLVYIFLAQYLGEMNEFYQIFWWWDLALHTIFGMYMVIIALYLTKGIIRKEQHTSNQRFTLFAIIFAVSFSIALAALWEMFEFIGDYFLKTNMVKGGIGDTSTDLLTNILGAFIAAIICYYRIFKKNFTFS